VEPLATTGEVSRGVERIAVRIKKNTEMEMMIWRMMELV